MDYEYEVSGPSRMIRNLSDSKARASNTSCSCTLSDVSWIGMVLYDVI